MRVDLAAVTGMMVTMHPACLFVWDDSGSVCGAGEAARVLRLCSWCSSSGFRLMRRRKHPETQRQHSRLTGCLLAVRGIV